MYNRLRQWERLMATNADQRKTSDTKPRVLASSATRTMRHERPEIAGLPLRV